MENNCWENPFYSIEPLYYQFLLKGHFDLNWSDWFEGLNVNCEEDNTTLLSGYIRDQAALFGVFLKIQNLGLTLLSVQGGPLAQREKEGGYYD